MILLVAGVDLNFETLFFLIFFPRALAIFAFVFLAFERAQAD
jgi:hypothetical protein